MGPDWSRRSPQQPLQVLYQREDLEDALSDITEQAFGEGVTVTRVTGSTINLLMGRTTLPATLPASEEYLNELRGMPAVSEQGDGIRSFVGIMLAVIAGRIPILLIDEPEAFLHPPQARLLGSELARRVGSSTQVVVATHSADFLNGLLDVAQSQNVGVVRLTRSGNLNHSRTLDAQRVRELALDPLLRYSGLLDAVFHRGIVVCESEGDSLFYQVVRDTIDQSSPVARDIMFSQCGGKQRIPKALQAVANLGVRCAAIADFDVLRLEHPLRAIYEALGGDWTSISSKVSRLQSAVTQLDRAPSISEIQPKIDAALSESGARLTLIARDTIREVAKMESGWERVKRAGAAALPSGEATANWLSLREELARVGLFVVPCGALEGWYRDVGDHGAKWVSDIIASGRLSTRDQPLREFVTDVLTFFRDI